jgi:chromosome segregation ATPase
MSIYSQDYVIRDMNIRPYMDKRLKLSIQHYMYENKAYKKQSNELVGIIGEMTKRENLNQEKYRRLDYHNCKLVEDKAELKLYYDESVEKRKKIQNELNERNTEYAKLQNELNERNIEYTKLQNDNNNLKNQIENLKSIIMVNDEIAEKNINMILSCQKISNDMLDMLNSKSSCKKRCYESIVDNL